MGNQLGSASKLAIRWLQRAMGLGSGYKGVTPGLGVTTILEIHMEKDHAKNAWKLELYRVYGADAKDPACH